MSWVRAVTLDLDDTLFPQQSWLAGAWMAVADRAAAAGLDGPGLHRELLHVAAEGSDRGGIIDRALAAVGVDEPTAYVPVLVDAFSRHAPEALPLYPGAMGALRRLAAAVPVVLVTDGNPRIQRAKIAALGIDHLLRGVVISDELGGRSARKPSPQPFRRALDLLAEPAAAVVHVGDRPAKDVAGAAAAGLRCVRVRTGEYAEAPDGDLVPWREADSFAEAVARLEPLLAGTAQPLSRL